MKSLEQKIDGRRRNNLSYEQRAKFGRAGGLISSQNRIRMKQIGKKGGLIVSQDREHMREIGRKGGKAKK